MRCHRDGATAAADPVRSFLVLDYLPHQRCTGTRRQSEVHGGANDDHEDRWLKKRLRRNAPDCYFSTLRGRQSETIYGNEAVPVMANGRELSENKAQIVIELSRVARIVGYKVNQLLLQRVKESL